MDTKRAFIDAASNLIHGYMDLVSLRLVGNTAQIFILDMNLKNKKKYRNINTMAMEEMREITPYQLNSFAKTHGESSMILAYSILDSFLSEVEEILFLHNPSNLGENIQVTLGKIMQAQTLEMLLHDIVRRKVRERGMWSLQSRLSDLEVRYGLESPATENEAKFISEMRNNIVHNRRMGVYEFKGGRITYSNVGKRSEITAEITNKFLQISMNIVSDLYEKSCLILKINKRFAKHRQNLDFLKVVRSSWSDE